MNELSLFSGAGGGLLATKHLLGWRTIGYVEIEEYCQKVIRQRIEDGLLDAAPIFGDIRKFISEGYAESYKGMVDVITGGFPCQDISCSGHRIGIDGDRSGLWKSMFNAICAVKPRYVFVENSPMLTLRGLGTVLRDLASDGYDARWCCLPASLVGSPHIRDRIWIMAYSGKDRRSSIRYGFHEAKGDWRKKAIGSTDWNFIKVGQKSYSIPTIKWQIPPEPIRMVNGVADHLERIRAIGNGQVPAVVEAAWKILSGAA